MMLVRPECQYVLSNLAAGYTRNFVLPLIVGGVKLQIFGKNLQVHLIMTVIINNSLILRNLNNFPWCILFDLPPFSPHHPYLFIFTVFRLLQNIFVKLLPTWHNLIISRLCRTSHINFPWIVSPLSVMESLFFKKKLPHTLQRRHYVIAPLGNHVKKCIKTC